MAGPTLGVAAPLGAPAIAPLRASLGVRSGWSVASSRRRICPTRGAAIARRGAASLPASRPLAGQAVRGALARAGSGSASPAPGSGAGSAGDAEAPEAGVAGGHVDLEPPAVDEGASLAAEGPVSGGASPGAAEGAAGGAGVAPGTLAGRGGPAAGGSSAAPGAPEPPASSDERVAPVEGGGGAEAAGAGAGAAQEVEEEEGVAASRSSAGSTTGAERGEGEGEETAREEREEREGREGGRASVGGAGSAEGVGESVGEVERAADALLGALGRSGAESPQGEPERAEAYPLAPGGDAGASPFPFRERAFASPSSPSEGPIVSASSPSEGPIVSASSPSEGPIVSASSPSEGPIVSASSPSEGPIVSASSPSEGPIVSPFPPSEGPIVSPFPPSEGPIVSPFPPSEGPIVSPFPPSEGPIVSPFPPSEGSIVSPSPPSPPVCASVAGASSLPSPCSLSGPSVASRGVWSRLVKPLRDFGLGNASLAQAGVGLFLATGLGLSLALAGLARGGRLLRRGRGYQAVVELPEACGLSVGAPFNVRGVQVGSVLAVRPSTTHVDVLVEVTDPAAVVPRDSAILANQSGLLGEPRLDVTPRAPLPQLRASPLDPGCEAEGLVVCHRGRIAGSRGVAVDDFVAASTRLALAIEAAGLDRLFAAVDAAQTALERGIPLVERAVRLADAALPVLADLAASDLLDASGELAAVAAEAARDARTLQKAVLDPDNVQALRKGIGSFARALVQVEQVAGDVGKLTGDRKVLRNVRKLLEALSRIAAE